MFRTFCVRNKLPNPKLFLMKKILLVSGLILLTTVVNAQLLKKLGDRAKNKMEQKAGEKVDKSIDDATSGKAKTESKTETNPQEAKEEETSTGDKAQPAKTEALKAYSKYDFVQGEKVIAYEDFSNTAVGDFPTRWNTNGSAEMVTLNQKEGKWFRMNNKGFYLPEFITSIPENSTLEFDLGVNNDFDWGNGYFNLYITDLEDRDLFTNNWSTHTIHFKFHPLTGANYTGGVSFFTERGKANLHNDANAKNWDNKKNLFAHVSIWRQGQRIRMYVNGDKLFDVPRAFLADQKYSAIIFQSENIRDGREDYYLLGNIRLAEGAPDTRSKLITEGRFVTSGITFDVNSDVIKPESYGVLREIAAALTENPTVKVRIIGHTDSDGNADKNTELSKRRAAAVKNALSSDFSIDASRLETDGLGATKPVADNKTIEGKAQNRRVEFVKL